MSEFESTYERIIAYLKGLLSNRQRHDLERKMMHDAFDEDAFEGLNQLSAGSLETDMALLGKRLEERIRPAKSRNLTPVFRIAAAALIVLGITAILYLIFRTPSPVPITQEIKQQMNKAPAETALPSAPKSNKDFAGKTGGDQLTGKAVPVRQETGTFPEKEEESAAPEATESITPAAAAAAKEFAITEEAGIDKVQIETRQKSAYALPAKEEPDQPAAEYLTGRVAGVDGEALPGVTVLEKGTTHGTITDLNGNFSLALDNSGSDLLFNYIGYKTRELNVRDIKGNTITMEEDLLALEEVVVVGYGTRMKNDVTGAVSRLEAKDISPGGGVEPYNFIKPAPPTGTLKTFKRWVTDRIDTSQFRDFPGKHKILFILTIQSDGHIRDINVRSTAPSIISDEYKKVISQGPQWQPALKDSVPVESEVLIRFTVTVE